MPTLKKADRPFSIDDSQVLVDCYRFKIEITKEGYIRLYAYNESKKGDIMVVVKPDSLVLVWEKGFRKEILKERLQKVIFSKLFEPARDVI